jgi:enoyl-CoA hydratase
MAVTGDPITAEEGERYGLVARVTAPGGALDEALALATRIAQNAPLGVAASKELIRASQGATEAELWAMQGPLQASVFTSNDAREGPAAFAEKRRPDWTGT